MSFERLGSIEIGELALASGKILPDAVLAYAIYGEPKSDGSNVIVICHALTGSHHVAGEDVEGLPPAWFSPIVGPGRAIDTNKFCVVAFNNLCSPYGSSCPMSIDPSTGREWRMNFPVITPRDIARAIKCGLSRLGIEKIAMIIGGSFGGMVALEFALTFPDATPRVGVIASPARLYPQAIAFNEVQRRAIMSDPAWRGGDYDPANGPSDGLANARMLAMITYRSERNFSDRWMRGMSDDSPATEWGSKFKVETYLEHHGSALVKRFDANCYLYSTRAMDLHDISAGRSSLEDAISALAGHSLLAVGISSDMLFPSWQVVELANLARKAGARARYEEIDSDNGHDAFLIDFDQVDEIMRDYLCSEGLLDPE